MTQNERLTGTPEEIRARLAEEFPTWSIIISSRGRWRASRTVLVREDIGRDAAEANDPDTLRALIRQKDREVSA